MGLSEESRHLAYDMDRDHLGEEGAAEMLSIHPDEGTTLVTTEHLDRRIAEVRAEIAELRGELRTEIAGLRGEVRTEVAGLRTEMAQLANQLTIRIGVMLGVATGVMALWG